MDDREYYRLFNQIKKDPMPENKTAERKRKMIRRCGTINRWLRDKVRKWLGLHHPSLIGIDFRVHSSTMIVIATELGGGYVKIIKLEPTGIRDCQEIASLLESRLGHAKKFYDFPRGYEL